MAFSTLRALIGGGGGGGNPYAIFGYGYTASNVSMTNKVDSSGNVATDTTGVGTARQGPAAASYG